MKSKRNIVIFCEDLPSIYQPFPTYIVSIKRNSASIFSLSNDSPQCFKAIRIKILKNVQLFLGIFYLRLVLANESTVVWK